MSEHDHQTEVALYGMCVTCARADRAEQLRGTEQRPPIARSDDPWSAKLAAARVEPSRGTRKAAVLALLRSANGSWVDGSDIATADVGGSEGLRRLRELREADGWPIERRPHPTRATSWQYRLCDT